MDILDMTRFGEDMNMVDPELTQVLPVFLHLHIHVLQKDYEVKTAGEGFSEICCHNCNASVLVHFTWDQILESERTGEGHQLLLQLADDFIEKHLTCPLPIINGEQTVAEDFMYICPNVRSDDIETIDIADE